MIQRNPYMGKPRTIDGKQVYALLSSSVMEIATGKIYDEVPEGASASDYAGMPSAGMLRCDQTGQMYENAHELEDTTRTYTEMFPDPRDLSEIIISGAGAGSYVNFNMNLYPKYTATKTYAKGDRVTAPGIVGSTSINYTFESDFDDNLGNTPNVYGWSVIDYGVEVNENIHWVTREEFNQIIEEENGSQEGAE